MKKKINNRNREDILLEAIFERIKRMIEPTKETKARLKKRGKHEKF